MGKWKKVGVSLGVLLGLWVFWGVVDKRDELVKVERVSSEAGELDKAVGALHVSSYKNPQNELSGTQNQSNSSLDESVSKQSLDSENLSESIALKTPLDHLSSRYQLTLLPKKILAQLSETDAIKLSNKYLLGQLYAGLDREKLISLAKHSEVEANLISLYQAKLMNSDRKKNAFSNEPEGGMMELSRQSVAQLKNESSPPTGVSKSRVEFQKNRQTQQTVQQLSKKTMRLGEQSGKQNQIRVSAQELSRAKQRLIVEVARKLAVMQIQEVFHQEESNLI